MESSFPMKFRIGTMVRGDLDALSFVSSIHPYGFESYQLFFWKSMRGTDPAALAASFGRWMDALPEETRPVISSLAIFGNPLLKTADGETARSAWEALIRAAPLFGCDLVTGFTGRIPDRPVEESLKPFRDVFSQLGKLAADHGVRLAFENCPMGGDWNRGDWNIAHNPAAWELMFNELTDDLFGLEWEPAHQIAQLIKPLPQLRKWVKKIFHLHGKDAVVDQDQLATTGVLSSLPFWEDRFPGFGDTDWHKVFRELHKADYRGTIDIEGHHDAFFKKELELTGQVRALEHLCRCRGGSWIPKPSGGR